MPVFSEAELVAGASGLDNEIHWVHIVDIPDASYEWHRRGVLLLTAGYGLRDDPGREAALVPKLVEQGFAGMVLSTGYYFDETPDVIRRAADALNFPVVETPPDLLFIEITEVILEHIVNRQYGLLQQSERIHSRLTELVLQGGELQDLAETLAEIIGRSITIEDSSFKVLTAAHRGAIDKARQRSVDHGRTTPELAKRLLEKGIYDRLLQRMGPVRVQPMPDLDMMMERFVAPIIVDRVIFGYIWIIAGDRPLNDLDKLALEHAATVAALILFKEKAVREAEESLRGDFLEQLLRGVTDEVALAEQAQRLNYRPGRPHQVLLVHGPPEAGGNVRSLLADIETWLAKRAAHALLVWRDRYAVLVLECEDAGRGKALARAMVADLSHPARRLLVGVGGAFAATDGEDRRLRHSYEEAQEAIGVSRALGRQEGVVAFDELGVLHWLYHLPPEARPGNAYLKHIDTLLAYDAERNADLVKTLEAYLDHGGSLVDAAGALYIHRNTLLHRLERISQLCGVDLRDPLERLNLHVVVKSYRLHDGGV